MLKKIVYITLLVLVVSLNNGYGQTESPAGESTSAEGKPIDMEQTSTQKTEEAQKGTEQAETEAAALENSSDETQKDTEVVAEEPKEAKKRVLTERDLETREPSDTKDYRASRPFQFQFLVAMGSYSPKGSFGPGGGVHIGYHISDTVYLGLSLTQQAQGKKKFRDQDENKYNPNRVYGQDNAESTESKIGPRSVLEMRVFPWDFGLYFSGGLLYAGKEEYRTLYEKELRVIGKNSYTTALQADVEYDEWAGSSIGIGFNHVFSGGVSIGVGGSFGLTSGITPKVTVTAIDSDTPVTEEDLDQWKGEIEDNEEGHPLLVYFALGYNF